MFTIDLYFSYFKHSKVTHLWILFFSLPIFIIVRLTSVIFVVICSVKSVTTRKQIILIGSVMIASFVLLMMRILHRIFNYRLIIFYEYGERVPRITQTLSGQLPERVDKNQTAITFEWSPDKEQWSITTVI